MTREDAVELILSGNVWKPCDLCGGTGINPPKAIEVGDPAILNADGTVSQRCLCKECAGSTKIHSAKALEAYALLGLNPAKPKKGVPIGVMMGWAEANGGKLTFSTESSLPSDGGSEGFEDGPLFIRAKG